MREKPSVSGLMNFTHEVERFENLFYKIVQSAYYNQEFGLDWRFWVESPFELPLKSFLSYVTQESSKLGIVLDSIEGNVRDFTLTIRVVIGGLPYEFQTVNKTSEEL